MKIEIESPFPLFAIPSMWRWIQAFKHRMADDSFPTDLDGFVERWEAFAKAGRKSWAIKRDGEIGGVVVSSMTGMITRDFHCIFRKDFWGKETTYPALNLILEEIFATGTEKLSTMAFADNHSIIFLMKEIGVTKEGYLSKQTRRDGKLVDMVMLGLEREKFYELRSEHVEHIGQHCNDGPSKSALQPSIDAKPDPDGNAKRELGPVDAKGLDPGSASGRVEHLPCI